MNGFASIIRERGEDGSKYTLLWTLRTRKLLSLKITDEKTGDSEVFGDLVEDLNLENCLGDGAYDTEEVSEILEKKGIGQTEVQRTGELRKNAKKRQR